MLNRRALIKYTAASAAVVAAQTWPALAQDTAVADDQVQVPAYLTSVADRYSKYRRGAAMEWFGQAKFGLFLHYGLYSLLGRGEWVQLRDLIHVEQYAKLKERFTAESFDAGAICDLAVNAGCKYVNITTRHHDSFCLCLLYTSPSPRDGLLSRMPSSA